MAKRRVVWKDPSRRPEGLIVFLKVSACLLGFAVLVLSAACIAESSWIFD